MSAVERLSLSAMQRGSLQADTMLCALFHIVGMQVFSFSAIPVQLKNAALFSELMKIKHLKHLITC